MPRDLFGDVTRPSVSIGNRKWYTVPVSLLTHSAIVFAVVVVPLLATDVLPRPWQPMGEVIIGLVPPAPPPPPRRRAEVKPPAEPSLPPTVAPEGFSPEKPVEPREPVEVDTPGIVGGDESIDRILAPPPEVKVAPPEPVRIGGAIRQPQRIRDVQPVYPPMAQAARVQGIVIIEATIGADGQIVNARVLRSVPLLDQAALDAVRQWQYTPTMLNGVAVPVIMTVTVQFTLSR
jgi:protein TonB